MPFVILDRDGVINEDSDEFIKCADEWRPIPGSLEAIAELTAAGFRIGVATNQSGIARGLLDESVLAEIHGKMLDMTRALGGVIEAVVYCPHGPGSDCNCRKPRPGLFLALADQLGFDPAGVPAIGDSYRDLVAAELVGAKPILVKTGKGERTLGAHPDLNVAIYANLYDAAQHILQGRL